MFSDGKIVPVNIREEMKKCYIDYAMSVIVGRALPDVRDGLKPVHRRILYAMNELGMTPDKPFKKCARIVGEVLGKYHPHGDSSVYEALVRLAQDFNTRYLVVDGHGNFGSVDGDGAAAMRYTEARMHKITTSMLADIDCETVDFEPNFDGSLEEPSVLPVRLPMLLLNGSSGIAVGMATNIPPHNLREVVDGTIALIDNPQITVPELMEYIKGPDFPTAATIVGLNDIKQAYETGRGSIIIRSKYRVEEMENGKKRVIFYEIPYQVNKATLIQKMASLIRDKAIQGVTYLNDESNREGIRIVMELKKDVQEEVILNQLFRLTPLQTSFGINMLALENGRPRQLPLKNIILDYIDHQVDVVVRKTQFDLKKAKDRAHILEGLKIAMDHIDEVIHLIRSSKKDEAGLVQELCDAFGLTQIQAKAILAMQLRRLSGLERDKIESEYAELLKTIADLEDILANHDRVLKIIRDDLTEINKKYGDDRRTEISDASFDMEDEDLIPVEDVIIMLTESGYIKRQSVDTYKAQNRGGQGVRGMSVYDDDEVKLMTYSSTHTDILFFTSLGRVYRKRGYEINVSGRQGKGIPVLNILNLEKGEQVISLIGVDDYKDKYLFFATKKGIVKRTSLSEFERINCNGKYAITFKEDDNLLDVKVTDGNALIALATNKGMLCLFKEDNVRSMGRTASGVKGINTKGGDVIGLETSLSGDKVFVLSELGLGKLSPLSDYRLTNRGAGGVITIKVTPKTGDLVGTKIVKGDEDVVVITNNGTVIRTPLSQVRECGRNSQGVKIISLKENESVSSLTILPHIENNFEKEENIEEKDIINEGEN